MRLEDRLPQKPEDNELTGIQVLFIVVITVVGFSLAYDFLKPKKSSSSVPVAKVVDAREVSSSLSYSNYLRASTHEKQSIFIRLINLPENKELKSCYLDNYCSRESVINEIKRREEYEAEKARRKAELGIK